MSILTSRRHILGSRKGTRVMVPFLVILFYFFVGITLAQKDDVSIGILAKRGAKQAFQRWQPLANYLSKDLGLSFKIVPLSFSQLENYVANGKVDLVLANQVFFINLKRRFGASALATVKNRYGGPYMGGVIFVRSQSRIRTLEQLRGKKIGVVSLKSAGGFVIQASELMKHGVNVMKDCQLKVFNNQDYVVYSVLNGIMDAGFVRTDQLESMVREKKIRLDQFTVLNKRTYPNFKLLCSTALWPAWPLAASKGLSIQLKRRITSSLVNMQPTRSFKRATRILGFIPPGDYSPVEAALQSLNML